MHRVIIQIKSKLIVADGDDDQQVKESIENLTLKWLIDNHLSFNDLNAKLSVVSVEEIDDDSMADVYLGEFDE